MTPHGKYNRKPRPVATGLALQVVVIGLILLITLSIASSISGFVNDTADQVPIEANP